MMQPLLFDADTMPAASTDTRHTGRCALDSCEFNTLSILAAAGETPATPARCANGHRMRWRKIEGTLNEGRRCNTLCTGATGHVCECACGGLNHGADFGGRLSFIVPPPPES